MSIDLQFYKKNKETYFTEEEIRNTLSQEFDIIDLLSEPAKSVVSFTVKPKDKSLDIYSGGFPFHLQETDGYWTYTYDYSQPNFNTFLKISTRVAVLLNLVTDDPYSGRRNVDPQAFLKEQVDAYDAYLKRQNKT